MLKVKFEQSGYTRRICNENENWNATFFFGIHLVRHLELNNFNSLLEICLLTIQFEALLLPLQFELKAEE